jgi:hypothetical protein
LDVPETLSEASRLQINAVAKQLAEETNATAVLLTGPQALGIDRTQDKLYFVSITNDPDGVIEHRFVEKYADVDRQMEIAIFPRTFVEKIANEGYWDMVSYRAAEALRTGIAMFDPTGYCTNFYEALANLMPERRFISGTIHRVKATFDDAVSLYSKGDFEGAVLVAREALRLGVEMMLHSASPGEEADLEAFLESRLGTETYRCLLEALGIKDKTDGEIRQHMAGLVATSKRILGDLGISGTLIDE